MRLHVFALLVGLAAPGWAQSSEEQDAKPHDTIFDGITVPPLLELTPSNWNEESKKTRWLAVKHYSPYCPHCMDFAPTYQTMYEFYYTSKPAGGATFSQYYDFRFATINCVAYSDLCEEHEVKSFPTTVVYENGKQFDLVKGNRVMPEVSKLIELALEKAKPGSRPKSLTLPEPGDTTAPKGDGKSTTPEPSGLPKGSDETASKPSDDKASDKGKGADTDKTGSDGQKPTPVDKSKETVSKKLGVTPNPSGVSVSLTAESFQQRVTMSQEPWFIKLYAPWCHHCQAMAPTWEQLAKSMRGKLNIAEVNCDKEPVLCKKGVNVKAFPTIMFFKGGERAEYTGLRGLGDFVQYAEKAVDLASGVPDVDAESLKALEQKEDVIFVYFYDHATTSEDFAALERLPLNMIGHAKLVKTKDPQLYDRFKITTWPRLLVSREGRPTYYPPLTPDEMRDVRGVLDWMKSVWLPLVPELTPSNARQVMNGKIVVLGVLNHGDQDAFQSSLREMKSAANEWMDRQVQEFQLERKKLRDSKQMRIEEAEDRNDQRALRAAKAIRVNMDSSGRKEVAFAWVDGVYWQRWIRTTFGIDVKDGERIIINDQDNRRYWDNTVTGNYILVSRTSIMETLDKIVYGPNVIKHKLTVSAPEKMLFDIRVAFSEHPFLSLGCVAGIGFGVFSWYRGRSRRRGGNFRLDDTMGIKELKEGLLGANGNQKAD
ncbi:thioredoxin domain-containing protein [Hirsutella rhossiliensis]|uniref:Thioredoxin domain-containing protein n=1 Tax=Hirsutella rhossiliensis TaxID=111463 RepID=A0A9P8SJU1_9HYPO|nr:thioredoxin domain-containing protein [Hirsutella rhossiliensis]KAH0965658.1 thioredoxin domain-containing protein [Hirsutella rhossiliensis]